MRARRRMLMSSDSVKYIFQSGIAKINGTVAREHGVSVKSDNILIDRTGYLSIKTDFSRFSKLYITISLWNDTDYGAKYGYGNEADTFTRYETKYTGTLETKVFDISAVTGEKYINFVNSGYMNSKSIYISGIWLEV